LVANAFYLCVASLSTLASASCGMEGGVDDKSILGVGNVFSHSSTCSASHSFYREQEALNFFVDPYAKPKEQKVGTQRPKIMHLPNSVERRTPGERQAEKQAVAAERRAIKKAARRLLKEQLLKELEQDE
jgi:hypothetical protein